MKVKDLKAITQKQCCSFSPQPFAASSRSNQNAEIDIVCGGLVIVEYNLSYQLSGRLLYNRKVEPIGLIVAA
ncbi:hypothetical protein D3C78_1423830 [compost metagenome]